MYYYLSEFYLKVRLLIILVFILELYLYFFTEDLILYLQNQFFFNRSSFFIEYHNTHLTYNRVAISNDLYFDIFVDYQILNNYWSSDIYIVFIYISLLLFLIIFIYEWFIYTQTILYKHEIMKSSVLGWILFYLFYFDLVTIEYVYTVNISMDSSIMYKTIEWALFTNCFSSIISLMIACFAINILAVLTIKTKLMNIIIVYIIAYYYTDVYYTFIFFIKWILFLEFKLYYKIYSNYLDRELKKNSSGICKGI